LAIKCQEFPEEKSLESDNEEEYQESTIGEQKQKISADKKNQESLCYASSCGNLELVKDLVKKGEEVNQINELSETPLLLACKGGHLNVVEFLVESGADVDQAETENGVRPIHVAAEKGYFDIVKFLVKSGVSVLGGDYEGTVAVDLAELNGFSEIVTYLNLLTGETEGSDDEVPEENVPVNIDDTFKLEVNKIQDPQILHKLSEELSISSQDAAQISVVKDLIIQGADVNFIDKHGNTPLFYAANSYLLDTAKYLVKNGANVNLSSSNKNTPILVAVRNGHVELVKYLLQEKADINQRNGDSLTPADIASQFHLVDISKVLEENRAD